MGPARLRHLGQAMRDITPVMHAAAEPVELTPMTAPAHTCPGDKFRLQTRPAHAFFSSARASQLHSELERRGALSRRSDPTDAIAQYLRACTGQTDYHHLITGARPHELDHGGWPLVVRSTCVDCGHVWNSPARDAKPRLFRGTFGHR